MSRESYVSYETAQLLKEKGFDWECRAYWHEDDRELIESQSPCHLRNITNPCWFGNTAPTQQMACRWLRERGIHIMPTIGCDVDRTPRIFYGAVIALFNDYGDIDYRDPLDENGYDEPEDAIEVALQYVLTNLI